MTNKRGIMGWLKWMLVHINGAFGTKWCKYGMGCAGLLVQLYELTGVDDEYSCINIINVIFGCVIACHLI